MCRMAGYAGEAIAPARLIYDAPHSLEQQACVPAEMVSGTVNVDGQARGRLRVVDFAAPEDLAPRGDGLLAAGEDAVARPVETGEVTILQGHLEGSNVDPVRTLVDMIAAQRAFEIGTKVLQANDQMLGKSVNSFQAR